MAPDLVVVDGETEEGQLKSSALRLLRLSTRK